MNTDLSSATLQRSHGRVAVTSLARYGFAQDELGKSSVELRWTGERGCATFRRSLQGFGVEA